jgi:hypothetical protein
MNNEMTVETVRDTHPEIVAQIEAEARAGMIAQAEHEAAVAAAKQDMVPKAEVEKSVASARIDAQAAERTRIMAIHASCQGSNTPQLFPRLVEDGCTEQQANHRIQDSLAVASDALDIQSHHGGSGYARKQFPNSSDIYASRGAK